MLFERKITQKLQDWKDTQHGKTALLIEGPRRVGKSTTVMAFARKAYKHVLLIDFANTSPAIVSLFNDLSSLDFFFLQLQTITGTRLIERESVIIFDEIQRCPKARQAVKYLVQDGRYDYIETGSLISIKQNVKDILIPSEEYRLTMVPMDFEEFLLAMGDDVTPEALHQFYKAGRPLGQATHRELMRKLRLYMLVGGMPQAVDSFIQTKDFETVDQVKRNILELYEADLHKIDPKGYLSQLFRSIPAQLNRNTSRYAVSSIIPSLRPGTALTYIAELIDSKTVIAAYHTSLPSADMAMYKDLTQFKLFLSDTGLFVTLMFATRPYTENSIYQKLLSDKLPTNLGYLYENLVAQMLTAKHHELFYHTFDNPAQTGKYEIDFLLRVGSKVCPIEVKSSGYRTHASLDAFAKKYHAYLAHGLMLTTKDFSTDQDLRILPIYFTPFL